MKNIILSSILILFLTSCGGKTSNIVSFTKPVASEEVGHSVIMPTARTFVDWVGEHNSKNIIIDPTHKKFKKQRLNLKAGVSAEPIIVDKKIFVLSRDGYLTAFDEDSLKKLWLVNLVGQETKSDYLGGGIAYHNGKLFITNGSRKFNVIDSHNGNVLFSKKFADILITKPVLEGSIVLLQTASNQLYLLELGSKALIWDHSGNTEVLVGGTPIAPVVSENGLALVSYTSGQVSLLDIRKPADVWQLDLSVDNTLPEYIPVNVAAAPIMESGYVYIAGNNGKVVKIELSTGHTIWKKEIDDVRTITNAVNALIMTTNGRQVIALDKVSGKVIWAVDIGEKGKSRRKWDPINYISVLMLNDAISVYTSDGEVYKISSDGHLMERYKIGQKLNFLTVTDKIRGFEWQDILISEPAQELKKLEILEKFKNMKLFNFRKKKEKSGD